MTHLSVINIKTATVYFRLIKIRCIVITNFILKYCNIEEKLKNTESKIII